MQKCCLVERHWTIVQQPLDAGCKLCHLIQLLALHADCTKAAGDLNAVAQLCNQFRGLLGCSFITHLVQVGIEASCNECQLRNACLGNRLKNGRH